MEREFWIERWKQQRIGFHQQQINHWLQRYFDALILPEGSRVFVPLAGNGTCFVASDTHPS